MIKKHRKDNIITNELFGWKIQGKVLKINIRTKEIPANAFLEVLTEEGEQLARVKISKKNHNIYPINKIISERVEDEEFIELIDIGGEIIEISETVQGKPIVDVVMGDYYYVSGNIAFKVTGLELGERIDSIKILYDFNQPQE